MSTTDRMRTPTEDEVSSIRQQLLQINREDRKGEVKTISKRNVDIDEIIHRLDRIERAIQNKRTPNYQLPNLNRDRRERRTEQFNVKLSCKEIEMIETLKSQTHARSNPDTIRTALLIAINATNLHNI